MLFPAGIAFPQRLLPVRYSLTQCLLPVRYSLQETVLSKESMVVPLTDKYAFREVAQRIPDY